MSKKKFYGVEVYVGAKGSVCIRQDEYGNDDVVVLSPLQVDLLIEWLQEAKREALDSAVEE